MLAKYSLHSKDCHARCRFSKMERAKPHVLCKSQDARNHHHKQSIIPPIISLTGKNFFSDQENNFL